MQRNSTTVMLVWKQWTDEHRMTRKTGSGRRKVTSARGDRHLLCMVVNDSTASSRLLLGRWSNATGLPGAIFKQDNVRPYVAKTVREPCSAQQMQHLSSLAYSPDILPIEHVCYLVRRRFALDSCPSASKFELLLSIQAI
ncbi:hypothetical protein TNCV_2048081 [Trichonephila clavipes]|nr:hypothetical protein TNCV_2048081 [Trichonephila clavipes]